MLYSVSHHRNAAWVCISCYRSILDSLRSVLPHTGTRHQGGCLWASSKIYDGGFQQSKTGLKESEFGSYPKKINVPWLLCISSRVWQQRPWLRLSFSRVRPCDVLSIVKQAPKTLKENQFCTWPWQMRERMDKENSLKLRQKAGKLELGKKQLPFED